MGWCNREDCGCFGGFLGGIIGLYICKCLYQGLFLFLVYGCLIDIFVMLFCVMIGYGSGIIISEILEKRKKADQLVQKEARQEEHFTLSDGKEIAVVCNYWTPNRSAHLYSIYEDGIYQMRFLSLDAVSAAKYYEQIRQTRANKGFNSKNNFHGGRYRHKNNRYQKRQQADHQNSTEHTALQDAYKLLKVLPSATDQEVKAAYHRECFKYHPDTIKSKNLNAEIEQFATIMLQKINAAYELIKKSRGMA